MAVDPTRSLPILPTADAPSTQANSAAKGGSNSFSDVLSRTDRSAATDKSARGKAPQQPRDAKPGSNKIEPQSRLQSQVPADNANASQPAAQTEAPTYDSSAPPPADAPPEEAADPAIEATADEEAAAIAATTILVPPTPLADAVQPAAAEVNQGIPAVDATSATPAAATTAVPTAPVAAVQTPGPVPPVSKLSPTAPSATDQVAEVPPVAVVEANPTAQPTKPIVAPQANLAEKKAAPQTPQTGPTEEPQPTTAETKQADVARPIEAPQPELEKKDPRDEHKDEQKADAEIVPTAAIETPVAPTTELKAADPSGGNSNVPPPDVVAAQPSVDTSRQTDSPQAAPSIGDTSSPSRLPPGIAGRLTSSREAPARPEVDTTRFLRRVAGAFQAAEERGTDVKLRLRPPELGVVQIQIKIEDGAITARMDAETPAARNLLVENLQQLRDKLAEQGLRIEKFEVNVSDRQSGGMPDPGPQSREQQSQTPRPGGPRTPTVREEVAPRLRTGPDAAGLNVLV